MIDLKRVKRYCNDNISLIENYEDALNDKYQTWHCHHRLETDANMSQKELKANNLYFHRPASELIFLLPCDHRHLHTISERNVNYKKTGEDHPAYGKKHSEEARKKQSIGLKKYYSDPEARKNHGNIRRGAILTEEHKQILSDKNTGARFMSNGIDRHYVLKEKIEYYLSIGYHFGMK